MAGSYFQFELCDRTEVENETENIVIDTIYFYYRSLLYRSLLVHVVHDLYAEIIFTLYVMEIYLIITVQVLGNVYFLDCISSKLTLLRIKIDIIKIKHRKNKQIFCTVKSCQFRLMKGYSLRLSIMYKMLFKNGGDCTFFKIQIDSNTRNKTKIIFFHLWNLEADAKNVNKIYFSFTFILSILSIKIKLAKNRLFIRFKLYL